MPSVMDKISKLSRVRWACRAIVLFATGVSIWGNYLSALPGDNISAAIEVAPPVFLFVTLEIMTRVPLPPGTSRKHWKSWSRPLSLLLIGGGCVWLSFGNQQQAFRPHTSNASANLLPIIIDATMIVALVTLIELNDQIRDLEATNQLIESREAAQADRPTPVRTPRGANKQTKVSIFLAKHPEMTLAQVAKATGVSMSTVSNVRKALREKEAAAAA